MLYGNCLRIILTKEFYETINTINFSYFCFDFIVSKKIVKSLNEYKNLTNLKFRHNNIFSNYQLTKLELFNNIQNLNISDNEVCTGYLLKYFVIYRINTLKAFNGQEIKNEDKKLSKEIFQVFDKLISIKEEENKDKLEPKKVNYLKEENNNLETIKENANLNDNIINIEIDLHINKLKFFGFAKFYLMSVIEEIIDDEDKEDMYSY